MRTLQGPHGIYDGIVAGCSQDVQGPAPPVSAWPETPCHGGQEEQERLRAGKYVTASDKPPVGGGVRQLRQAGREDVKLFSTRGI